MYKKTILHNVYTRVISILLLVIHYNDSITVIRVPLWSSSSYSLGTLPIGVQCTINHFFPHLSFNLLILRESVYLSGSIPGYHLAILSLVFLFFAFRPLTPASHSLSFARSPFYICVRTG